MLSFVYYLVYFVVLRVVSFLGYFAGRGTLKEYKSLCYKGNLLEAALVEVAD